MPLKNWLVIAAVVLFVQIQLSDNCFGQQNAVARDIVVQPIPPRGGSGGSMFILADRKTQQRMREAKEYIEKKEYGEAIRYLQAVLDAAADSFYHPDPKQKTEYRSIREAVHQMIGSLPAEGKTIYLQIHGAAAQGLLKAALEEKKQTDVAAVFRRFFHTPAGYEACYRMGVSHQDQARPLAAALCFQRLLNIPEAAKRFEPYLSIRAAVCWNQMGLKLKAATVLKNLRQSHTQVSVAGEAITIPETEDRQLTWLEEKFGKSLHLMALIDREWVMFGGNAARNPAGKVAKSTLAANWNSNLVRDPLKDPSDNGETALDREMKTLAAQAISQANSQQQHAIPRMFPLVVGDSLIARTAGNVTVFNLKDGERTWQTIGETGLADLLEPEKQIPQRTALLQGILFQRLFQDSTHGTMSSDGKFLFTIEELDYHQPYYVPSEKPGQPHTYFRPADHNTLVAYHLENKKLQGQRAWAIGGLSGDELLELPLSGTFFLGAPLPLAGKLYCLADISGEIRLLALNPEDGTLDWEQPIANAGWNISQDQHRRNAGTSATFAEGVMVCTTASGLAVAVDITNRSLLWGYQFQPTENNQNAKPGFPIRPQPFPNPRVASGWLDTLPMIADGKVILTPHSPNGTREIHCLDLLSGELLWKQQPTGSKPLGDLQGNELYLGGIADGKVFVVSMNSVQAFDLKTGNTAWEKSVKIDLPSGRGFIHDDALLVPVSSGAIVAIRTTNGERYQDVLLPGNDTPGNLIGAQGVLISQTPQEIRVFPLPELKEKTKP